MRLGRPEFFHNNTDIRLLSIKRVVLAYQQITEQIKTTLAPQDDHTKLYLVGLGNEPNLLSCFKDLLYNSRELLDILLIELSRSTAGTAHQVNTKFPQFARSLMNGDYDIHHLPVLQFLKNNFTYIFHIRKVRNLIKESPKSIEFRYNTNRFEATFIASLVSGDVELIQHLDIAHKDEAMEKMQYHITYNLDKLFPEMAEFWKTCHSLRDNTNTSI